MQFIQDNPGLLFVIATLLPLVSFTLLLLAGAARGVLRQHQQNPTLKSLYELLGGDVTGRGPAYVGLASMVLAFGLSFYGFVLYLGDYPVHLHHSTTDEEKLPAKVEVAEKKEGEEEHHGAGKNPQAELRKKHRLEGWEGSVSWARLSFFDEAGTAAAPGSELRVGYYIDHLSALMFVMVTFVASLIHLFSTGYMADELNKQVEDHEVHAADGHYKRRGRFGRFFMFLSLFCFSMLNLLLADNLFQIFVSWELVGICSFLLIGFYYERTSASNAANKAFIVNRIGDAGFLIGLMILWTYLGTFNFQDIFQQVRAPALDAHDESIALAGTFVRFHDVEMPNRREPTKPLAGMKIDQKAGPNVLLFHADDHIHGDKLKDGVTGTARSAVGHERAPSIPYVWLVVAGLGIFLGCVGKSAQFPLQVWLPDAMEGPTPVSALIHAATMVAAGVYLVGRVFPIFTFDALLVIAYVGAITLFVAATIAVVVTDIKKVLAYSTVSQLGYMMLALGIGGWAAGLFHLMTHAFFKALLFLGSGSVIYGCHHQQDMQKMGGLFPKMKITALTMLVGVFAIAGIPLFSGWYSKDAVLANALSFFTLHREHFLLFVLPLVTAGITTFYMFRMWFMTFTGEPRDDHVYEHAHESPWIMTVPLILLAILSFCVAWGWPIYKADHSWLEHAIAASQPAAVENNWQVQIDAHAQHGANHGSYKDMVHESHAMAGYLALGVVLIGLAFAASSYLFRFLDPAESKEAFPGVHRFLQHKWYFDELYSVLIVRPGLVIAHWCRAFDTYVIDGIVNRVGSANLAVSRWHGWVDKYLVDGAVNLVGNVTLAVGLWLRNLQTGYLRSYVLFLVLASIGIWAVLALVVAAAP